MRLAAVAWLCLGVGAAAADSSVPAAAAASTDSAAACERALRAMAAHEFADWQPLPAECPLAVPRRLFGAPGDFREGGRLGSARVPLGYSFTGQIGGFPDGGGYWLAGNRIVAINIETGRTELTLAALRAALKEPDVTLDWQAASIKSATRGGHSTSSCRRGELVYARLGISVFSCGGELQYLLIYPPTTVAEYKRALRPNLYRNLH